MLFITAAAAPANPIPFSAPYPYLCNSIRRGIKIEVETAARGIPKENPTAAGISQIAIEINDVPINSIVEGIHVRINSRRTLPLNSSKRPPLTITIPRQKALAYPAHAFE